jgi:putative ABC transport system substrate-binding protein
MTTRRGFLQMLPLGVLAVPLATFSQRTARVWRVGFLSLRGLPAQFHSDPNLGAFLQRMQELGYAEGRNLSIEMRSADGKAERLAELAAELVRANVDVIVTSSTPATSAAQRATNRIPIVMTSIGDPVGSGLIKTLARPGGNITGLTTMAAELSLKRLEMLRSVTPKLAHVGVLINPENSTNIETFKSVDAVAQKLGIRATSFEIRTLAQLEDGFLRMKRDAVQAVLLAQDGVFIQHKQRIAELALRNRLPSIGALEQFVEAGLLLSYGPNLPDVYRRAALYVDKLVKGAKPADLPVEQPTRFDLVVNKRTAMALGITVPADILVRAERFIE